MPIERFLKSKSFGSSCLVFGRYLLFTTLSGERTIKIENPYESSDPKLKDESNSKPPFIERLEDAVLKFVPILGGVLGGPIFIAMTDRKMGGLIGFMIGGAIGAVVIYLPLLGLFYAINPSRDRGKK